MASRDLLRRLRGAVGNALVWGAGWFGFAVAIITVQWFFDRTSPTESWFDAIRGAAKFGVMGTIAGGAFSTFIGLWYRGRRVSEINWVKFGLGGGLVTGLFVPAFIVVMRLISGDDFLPLRHLAFNGMVGAVLGGAAAAVSMKIAQLSQGLLSGKEPELLESEPLSMSASAVEPRPRAAIDPTDSDRR